MTQIATLRSQWHAMTLFRPCRYVIARRATARRGNLILMNLKPAAVSLHTALVMVMLVTFLGMHLIMNQIGHYSHSNCNNKQYDEQNECLLRYHCQHDEGLISG